MAAAFLDAAKSDSRVPGISTSQHEGHGQDAALIAFDGGVRFDQLCHPSGS